MSNVFFILKYLFLLLQYKTDRLSLFLLRAHSVFEIHRMHLDVQVENAIERKIQYNRDSGGSLYSLTDFM